MHFTVQRDLNKISYRYAHLPKNLSVLVLFLRKHRWFFHGPPMPARKTTPTPCVHWSDTCRRVTWVVERWSSLVMMFFLLFYNMFYAQYSLNQLSSLGYSLEGRFIRTIMRTSSRPSFSLTGTLSFFGTFLFSTISTSSWSR